MKSQSNCVRTAIRVVKKRLIWAKLSRQFPQLRPKEIQQLGYQKERSDQFRKTSVQARCLEYWKLYRYLGEIEAEISLANCRIVDVGCGITTVLHFIPGEKYGLDSLADYYKTFYQYPSNMTILQGSAEDIPLCDDFCDVVFCSGVIIYVDDPSKVMSEIYRILKPRGHLVLTTECFDKPHKKGVAHCWSPRPEDIEKLLSQFVINIKKSSPWIGLGPYSQGSGVATAKTIEMIVLCESTKTYKSTAP